MVVLALGELGDAIHERHRRDEVIEAEDTLDGAVDFAPSVRQGHRRQYARVLAPARKERPSFEVLCELVYRPLAHLVVLGLLPLRVPPPAVVAASATVGLVGAVEIGSGNLLLAALLLQVKTVLDNADGQLARASGRVTVFGRYLDSESDLFVNAAIFVGLGWVTGRPWVALVAFLVLTLVLSLDFNLERLYRRELGEPVEAMPAATGAAVPLARLYAIVYAPQDRLIERFVEWRLRNLPGRRAYHDRATLSVLANFGLSTQLAVLGVCLVAGRPSAYFWVVLACGVVVIPIALRREHLSRSSAPVP
jgi:archaetidylinositol phosphate synthase